MLPRSAGQVARRLQHIGQAQSLLSVAFKHLSPAGSQQQQEQQQGLTEYWAGPSARSLFSQLQSFSTHQHAPKLLGDLSAPPKSLLHERGDPGIPPDWDTKWGRMVFRMLGFYSKKQQLEHGAQHMYEAIKEQVDDGALQKAFGMDTKVFFSTYTLLALHVWLVIHRLGHRSDSDAKFWRQRFYVQFCKDVELRIYGTGLQIGVSRWAKKLETIFYSSSISFDKSLSKESPESVEEVVLREFFGNDLSKRGQAQLITKYLQRELACVQITDDEAILKGNVRFSSEPFAPFRSGAAAAAPAAASGSQAAPVEPVQAK